MRILALVLKTFLLRVKQMMLQCIASNVKINPTRFSFILTNCGKHMDPNVMISPKMNRVKIPMFAFF